MFLSFREPGYYFQNMFRDYVTLTGVIIIVVRNSYAQSFGVLSWCTKQDKLGSVTFGSFRAFMVY